MLWPTQEKFVSEEETGPRSAGQRRWMNRLIWGGLITLALIVYELTAQPGVSVAIFCTKFAYQDWRTGWWMWRRDTNRGRALACLLFLVGCGLWKIFAGSIAMMAVLGIVKGCTQIEVSQESFIGAIVTCIVAAILAALIPFAGAIVAWNARQKIWISRNIHRMRRAHEWPPIVYRENILEPLVMATIVIAVFPVTGVQLLLDLPPNVLGISCVCSLCGTAVSLYYLFRGVFAVSPEECWKDSV